VGALEAVVQAPESRLSDEQTAEVYSMMDMEAHKDQVLLIVNLGGTTPQE
jgi:hypothetical protein